VNLTYLRGLEIAELKAGGYAYGLGFVSCFYNQYFISFILLLNLFD